MRNLHLLPTDKPGSKLIKHKVFNEVKISSLKNLMYWDNANIYITSDEEISGFENNIWVILGTRVFHWQNTMALVFGNKPKKIILTTDDQLIKDGVQTIPDEFLEWFVKNPSCEYVEVKDITTIPSLQLGRPNGHLMYKIIIPQEESKTNLEKLPFPKLVEEFANYYKEVPLVEESKQETLEEFAERMSTVVDGIDSYSRNGCKKAIIIGANWQAERMYSEALEFAQWISHNDWVYLPSKNYWVNEEQEELEQKLSSEQILELWFKENKNK
jgi:hypothetical protein